MVRFYVLLSLAALLILPVAAQSPDTGEGPVDGSSGPRAQLADPGAVDAGARQDAEASRERLLKAADQIEMIQNNAEATRVAVEQMKASMTKLEDENTALKLQVTSLQKAVDEAEADREKQRQVLLDEVSRLVAEKSAEHPHASHRDDAPKHEDTAAPEMVARTDDTLAPAHHHHTAEPTPSDDAPPLTPPPDPATSGPTESAGTADASGDGGTEIHTEVHHAHTTDSAASEASSSSGTSANSDTETHHAHRGYLYVVKAHETLSLICAAYRDQGVNVTVAEVRKANGLTPDSTLHAGQKIFIPKPGT